MRAHLARDLAWLAGWPQAVLGETALHQRSMR